MSNPAPLMLREQLWMAIETLPHPATCRDPVRTERAVNPVAHPRDVGPGGTLKLGERIAVQFERFELPAGGATIPAWRFLGPVRITPEHLDVAGGRAGLPRWIRDQLGERCVHVQVVAYDDGIALVNLTLHW